MGATGGTSEIGGTGGASETGETGGMSVLGEMGEMSAMGATGETTEMSGKSDIDRAWELFDLINPIRHATTPAEVERYRVEPYVTAADVYAVDPHAGRGGWTWYTGSAAWMYRLIVETLLGLQLEGGSLRVNPRLPSGWNSLKLHYRHRGETFYHITVKRRVGAESAPPTRMTVDGQEQPNATIQLVDDRREHVVEIEVGEVLSKAG
jgi:cellobiose phosphorylase